MVKLVATFPNQREAVFYKPYPIVPAKYSVADRLPLPMNDRERTETTVVLSTCRQRLRVSRNGNREKTVR